MFDDIRGKRVLITGASSGLGQHFARLFAQRGAAVTLAARRLDRIEAECEALRSSGAEATAVALDVRDSASIAHLFAEADQPFDIVVNNAGISGAARALDLTEGDWDATLDVNLKGPFLVAQAAAKALRQEERGGSIVNVASIVALRVATELSAYAASKAGLVHLTRALSLEWARYGIRVNALCPGYVETEINRDFFATPAGEAMVKRIPQRRLGRMEDLDGAMLLLASEAGAYITGTALVVDGGHSNASL
ncbi:SDR family oxidoreductase [Tianweitania sp. BSSL-BM11]|uniref:SDR family oxidoreductase n=1 Tax=Tianweitania aestuarii TaxID=2814886 RepID=A0ABS5RW68_9HYPH|nr:SDR family NAD(P)-dependent oxidoreductase [Tianweitania aestuarii]MBS9721313.1 SDR family oxidoreductase [Tianweitania aestuarii]